MSIVPRVLPDKVETRNSVFIAFSGSFQGYRFHLMPVILQASGDIIALRRYSPQMIGRDF